MGLSFVAALATVITVGTAAGELPVQGTLSAPAVDARVVLPSGVGSKSHFVRFYFLETIRSDGDLPFTTGASFQLPKPREVWLALFIRTPSSFSADTPGLRLVADIRKFPRFDHGGCLAVNVVADASTGATLGSWCNITYLPGKTRPVPTYFPKGSPISLIRTPGAGHGRAI